ncbi:MAG: hypothetical protein EOO47_00820 [Flavobacterium sp.]|nr:MAG: hypothetical protein EOO47_00820 [Flavobacterium sp.]
MLMNLITNLLRNSIILLFTCLCNFAYAQNPVLAPSQDKIKQIVFSADGDFLLTGSDDHKVILTDLRKRLALVELKNVDLLVADEVQNYFYTKKNVGSDSIIIEKRAIPSADILYTLKIPQKLNADTLILEEDLININTAEETFQYVYREGYLGNAPKHLITFSKNGKVIADVKGVIDGQINGILRADGVSWIISSSALWKQQSATFEKVLKPSLENNAFANFKVRGDTLALLSNKQIQWYSIKSNKVFKQHDISSFVAEPSAMYVHTGLMSLTKNHLFYLDKLGTIWFANTGINSEKNTREAELFYSLVAINDKVEYPLSANRNGFYTREFSIETPFAYNEQKQIFALMVGDHIEIVDRRKGYLFANQMPNVPVENLFFTATPGQILLTAGTSTDNPAYMLNLSNGWIDTYGALDYSLYENNKATYFPNFKTSTKTIQLYNDGEKRFLETPILEENNTQYLKLPLRATLAIETQSNQITLNRENVLNWKNKQGNEIAKIELKIEKEKIGFNYVYQKYSYNEATNLLILFYAAQRDFSIYQLWIDTEKREVIKETIHKDLVLFKDGKKYASPEGIFNIDASPVKLFTGNQKFELLALSKTEDYFIGKVPRYTKGDEIYAWNWKKDSLFLLGKQLSVNQIIADPHSEAIFTRGFNGSLMIWNPALPAISANIKLIGANEFKNLSEIQAGYLVLLSNGYYMASGKYNGFLNLADPKNIYSASYIDGAFHKPELVLSTLGYVKNQKFLKTLGALSLKRSAKFKLSTAGVDVVIKNKQRIPYYLKSGLLELEAEISGNLKNAKTYMVYVNGTAFMPFPGKPTTGNKINELIYLKDDNNHIKICLIDLNNVETKGDFLIVSAPAVKKRNLYFIGLGVSQYLDKSKNLKYAAKDVNDVMNFFKSNKSYVTKKFYMLTNERAITGNVIDSVKKFLSTANEEDQVIFFFAGHGIIGNDEQYYLATHNVDFKLPQLKGLNINAVNDLLAACKARRKIMFIDACHSGLVEDIAVAESGVADPVQKDVVISKRGVDFGDGLATTSSQIYFAFNQFNQGSGIDIISAAAGNEYAYEAVNKIPNGVFTYNLLKALKTGEADFNQDKIISISELQNYVAKATLKMTSGMQKPAFRQANIYQDIPVLAVADSYTGQWLNAASNNNVPLLQQLLKQGVEIDVADEDGFTALHFASRQGSTAAVEFLIGQKASVLLNSNFGFSALYLAALNGHETTTYMLLKNGADVSIMPTHQSQAVSNKGNKIINGMLADFANVRVKEEQQLVFSQQIADNNMVAVEENLKTKKIDPDYFTITGSSSPLFIAIVKKKHDVLKMLLNYGANPNHVNNAGISPLMLAVYIDDLELIKMLLEGKADKNLKDKNGKTALDYAVELKKEATITILR